MPFSITPLDYATPHLWGIAVATCDLEDRNDRLVAATIALVRKSYSENAVLTAAEALLSDEIESGVFNLQHLKAAIREGFPNPEKEKGKPVQLTNYRSQSAEMVAKLALSKAYNYQYPVAPQDGAANPNQPILGFDGWGILEGDDGLLSLALIQVKATDVNKSPPDDSKKLAEECRRAPTDRSAICRTLTLMCRLMHGDPLQTAVLKMLEKMGRSNDNISIVISPAVVRGLTTATASDFAPILSICDDVLPSSIRAIAVSIGVELDRFGYLVMDKAREAI